MSHLPDLANVTPESLEPLIDHLSVTCEEMLSATKAALRGEMTEAQAHQLVASAVSFNALAAQLGALALHAAINRLKEERR